MLLVENYKLLIWKKQLPPPEINVNILAYVLPDILSTCVYSLKNGIML